MSVMKRKLGRSNIEISAMGIGCWAIGGFFGEADSPSGWGSVEDQESIRGIHAALDRGITFFDTADVYGAGHSERLLGQALAGRRDQVIIATKFGVMFDEHTRGTLGTRATPEYIRQACEDSLKRLNTDYIDLYQFHLNDFAADEADVVREVLEDLAEDGKIRFYGWSTDFPDRALVFAEGEYCTAVQLNENVLEDNATMIALCEREKLAAINRGPLAMGLLTGKYKPDSQLADDDVRGKNSPSWLAYFKDGKPNPEWLAKVDAVGEILQSNGRTLAQGALAWLWGRSENTIPIPGYKTVQQIEENTAAMDFGPLTAAQMTEIDQILERA